MDSYEKIYIAGHRGLAGSAIWRKFKSEGFTNLIGVSSRELDLRDRAKVFEFIHAEQPTVIVDAAARVGGIHANETHSYQFLSENLQIQVNLMDAAAQIRVPRLLFLGSSCIYPKHAPQPMQESSLMTGALEPTNDGYAIAKIAGILEVQTARKQYGLDWIAPMPANLYGPGDSFDPNHSHVLAGLIRRIHQGKLDGAESVIVWGSGRQRRELLHVDDLADACYFLLQNYHSGEIINVGTGEDITIRDLALLVAETVGFQGEIIQDLSRPDGSPQKLLDISRLKDLGWRPKIRLRQGIQETYEWFLQNAAS